MKLHLPKKFQTALMAAFATVSFTTVSTASLGAAVFAFAGYQAAAEEATNTELSEADKEGQEEIRDNIRFLQEKQDEENERDFTVDPVDWDVMERRAKNLERAGDAAASGIAKAAYEQMEAEIFTPATTAAPAQQQASAGSGELPSDDLGFTTNPYASSSPANSEPVFEVTPAAATTTDFLLETSTEQESTSSSSSGSSTPAPASSSGFGGSADSGYVPFGHVSANSIPLGVSSIPAAANGTPQLAPLGAAEANATNLIWEGDGDSKGTWKVGGDDPSSPWRFTPEASAPEPKAFKDGDYAQFTKNAEVTVEGSVHAGSLQIDAGSESSPIVVTINTPENTTLTADHVVSLDLYEEGAPYTNKIVKTGAGEVNFSVDDPNFKTQIHFEDGSATVNFNPSSSGEYNLYTRLSAEDTANVTLNFNGASTANVIDFKPESSVRGVDTFIVNEDTKVRIESSSSVGSGFYMDQENTTIRLTSNDTMSEFEAQVAYLTSQHLQLEGEGYGTFLNLNWQTSDTTNHAIKGMVDTWIQTLNYYGDVSTVCIDDGARLAIADMYMNKHSEGGNKFFHAFQNDDNIEGERQSVSIDKLYVADTAYIGAASLDQGAAAGYQEAGTVDVGTLYGTGTVIFENNVEVTQDTQQCLTEVFKLTKEGNFSGNIRLAAANNGTQEREKKAVLLFKNLYTAYNSELELQADADYTEYAIVMNDKGGLSTTGIRDVGAIPAHSNAMIYSGTISDAENAACMSDGFIRTIYLFADSNKNYESSFGMSSGIDIDFSGAGSQAFKGDFKDFKGDITVGGTRVLGSTLSFIEQKTALNVVDLLLRPDATLDVKASDNQNQLIKVSGTLTAQEYVVNPDTKQEQHGASAVVNGDLEMEAGSVLDVSAFWGDGGLDLRGSLTFDQGALLSDKDMAMINGMKIGEMYDLAFDVTALDGHTEAIDWIGDDAIDASTIFGQNQFYQGEFYLCYSGNGQEGGYGNNVGTVYLYRALPEPTTGTLSLLALAALAARRRRK